MSDKVELPVVEERCETCRYWNHDGREPQHGDTQGDCRRYPPVIVPTFDIDTTGEVSSAWCYHPVTDNGDWCGEWQAKRTPAGRGSFRFDAATGGRVWVDEKGVVWPVVG